MEGRKVVSQGIVSGVIYIVLFILFITGIPLINIVALLALPLPIVYFAAKYGLKPGVVLVAVVGLIGTVVSNGMFLLPIGFAAIGLAVGHFQHMKRSAGERLLAAIVPTFLFFALGYVMVAALYNLSFIEITRDSLQETQQIADGFGLDVYDDAIIDSYLKSLESMMTFLLLIFAAVYASIVYAGSVFMFRRIGLEYQKLPKFRDWEFPRITLIFYFVFWFLSFIPFEAGSFMASAAQTGFYLISVLLIIQGLSLLVAYFYYKKISTGVRVLLLIAVGFGMLVLPLMIVFIRILGAFDMIFRLRDRLKA